jgi:glycosyltransferase involved in cell wall biosynthesis
MAIHQILHTLSYGDAISGEVLALYRAFKEFGVDGSIWALNVNAHYRDGSYSGFVNEIIQDTDRNVLLLMINNLQPGDTIILHYSLGSILNDYFVTLCEPRVRKVVIYHNITPAFYYASINKRVARDIESGIADLPRVCEAANLILADSEFNQYELNELGFSSEVLLLPLDPVRWQVSANSGIARILLASDTREILHVGRLAPNKCIEDIIKVFYFYHHYINKKSRLWIVGTDTDTEIYSFGLRRMVYDFSLEDAVNFTGAVADEELRAFYEGSDAYLCMSEHEGFCLPVVEALHYGVPVIAYSAGALPGTIGNAGVLVKEKRFAEVAELLDYIIENGELSSAMISAGRQRVTQLSYDSFKVRVKDLLLDI